MRCSRRSTRSRDPGTRCRAPLSGIPTHLREISTYEPTGLLWPLALIAAMVSWETIFPVLIFALIFFSLQPDFLRTDTLLSLRAFGPDRARAGRGRRQARALDPIDRSAAFARRRADRRLAAGPLYCRVGLHRPASARPSRDLARVAARPLRISARARAGSPRARLHPLHSDPPDPNLDLDYNPPAI